jgi:archaellin
MVADGTAPTVIASVRADADPTSATSVNFTVTFSEGVSGVDLSDFVLTTTGISGAAVTDFSGSGETYTVSVDTGTGNGTIRLDVVNDDSILDTASNPLGSGFASGEVYTVDKGNTTPPSRPALVAPPGGSLQTDYTPLFDWNNSTAPAGTIFSHYQIQVATDNGFVSLVLDVNIPGIANSEFTPSSDLASNSTFYWRVRAVNAQGNLSAWSNIRNFDTALLPPVLVSPADGLQLSDNRPTFDWEDVPGAGNYRIQISDDPGFSSTLKNTVVTPSTYAVNTDLPAGVLLYWRVRTQGTNGPSLWSEVRSFNTANPPSVPTLASPGNNAKVSGPSPLFDWNDSTVPAGTDFDRYQIQIAADNGFVNIVHDNDLAGIANSQDSSAVLAGGTTYYWRVRAINTLGQASAWSNVRSVRIKFFAPILLSPGNGTTASNLMPTFTWEAVDGATIYTIQVSKNDQFTGAKAVNTTTTDPFYIHNVDLESGITYYWRVRVYRPTTYGPSDWSEVFTFATP